MTELKLKLLELKKKELALRQEKIRLESELPHLYGRKFYSWSRKFFESTNRVNLLCAANQISKSSTMIRRCIANATDKARWERMWGKGVKPTMFWYFYPDQATLEREWITKWSEWLPKGRMEFDPVYGWKVLKDRARPVHIKFNTGVYVFFQTYTKNVSTIQAGSVYEVFCDEELPLNFYDEIMFRLVRTNGIFNSAFTPTLNQFFWQQAIESKKILPDALKIQVSMYDCLEYEDGTPGAFTEEKIKEVIAKCKSETEVQRRVYGRFVTEEGRAFYAFNYERNMVSRYPIDGWYVYGSVDYGSGGPSGHPAGIVFVAVRPDYRKGVVFKAWRGDGEETTAGDVFNKYMSMRKDLLVVQQVYDPASRDFGLIASRNGVSFIKANKAKDYGEDIVNTLFKHGILDIFDDDPELEKLASELLHMMKETSRSVKNQDDLADALRYACAMIPWDYEVINEKARVFMQNGGSDSESRPKPLSNDELMDLQIKERRGLLDGKKESRDSWVEIDEEIEYWNQMYEK